jgi:hypothetical protein
VAPVRRRKYKAWVVRWEWAIPEAAVERPVAAVLPPRLAEKDVRRIVEVLYATSSYTPDEMLEASRANGRKPYPAVLGSKSINLDGTRRQMPWAGEVVCGHDPWLVARKATVWPSSDDTGGIIYDELLSSGETQRRSSESSERGERR